jgi:hypothetical protein
VSPKNGNISNIRQRLSAISLLDCPIWESRDGAPTYKIPQLAGLSRTSIGTISSCNTAWLGRDDSNLEMANWKSDALACPREAAEPLFAELHKSLETFGFREPYRIGGVQSSGEKRAFRRIISRPCRSAVRSSDEKSLLLLGLIANKFERRTHGLGQAGGGRGTGIEPSPRRPEYSSEFLRT